MSDDWVESIKVVKFVKGKYRIALQIEVHTLPYKVYKKDKVGEYMIGAFRSVKESKDYVAFLEGDSIKDAKIQELEARLLDIKYENREG